MLKDQPKTPRIAGKNLFLQYEQCKKLSLPDIADEINKKLQNPYEIKESLFVSTSNNSKIFCFVSLTGRSKRVDTDPSFFNIKKKRANGSNLSDGFSGFCNRVISESGDMEEELSFVGSEQLFEILDEKRREYRADLSNKYLNFERNADENYDQSTYYSSNICRSPTLSFSCSNVPSKPNSLSANSQQVYEDTIRSLREQNQILIKENSEKDAKYQVLENKCRNLESQLEDILVCMKQLQSSHSLIQNSHDVLQKKMESYEKNKNNSCIL